MLAALCGVIGHNFSVFLGFKGGKGIATSLGALVGVAPLCRRGRVDRVFGGVSHAALGVARLDPGRAVSLPLLALWRYPGQPAVFAFTVVACVMAVYKHRANIQRLRAGTEPKVCLPWNKKAGLHNGLQNAQEPQSVAREPKDENSTG